MHGFKIMLPRTSINPSTLHIHFFFLSLYEVYVDNRLLFQMGRVMLIEIT